ncbi:MAG: hypothetical protein Q7T82_06025 [Armatimonadota bacterium]|nr:hypothetical protein [Armatimonadota bacterium]
MKSILLGLITLGVIITVSMASAVPTAPTIVWPMSGKTTNKVTPRIHWSGATHTSYQVRVSTANDPNTGVVWDSGQISSTLNQAVTGTLISGNTYYVFARIADGSGWGNWSALGHSFMVDTAYQWPRRGNVRLVGYHAEDDGGPFLGLGFSYMSALRRCKYDRDRFRDDLAFMASNNFKYMRALSMVGWYTAWVGKEIAPINFYNQAGTYVPAWSDYWTQLVDMIDIAYDEYGIRTELTIFADAQLMPNKTDRINHMQTILDNIASRQQKVMHLEVCNEAWQNGFPGTQGEADLREFGAYLAARIPLLVALTSNHSSLSDMENLYYGSAATLCTYHLDRDTGELGWIPVRDAWKCYPSTLPPTSSNEPIGPGSSVDTEEDPTRLVSAACFAWIAKLPMYVYHTDAGVFGNTRFQDKAAVSDYRFLEQLLPPDLPGWTRNDGIEGSAPFTAYCNSTANMYWTDVPTATDGCHRNIGSTDGTGATGEEFVCYPQGIKQGGVTLKARRQLNFTVYDPRTGAIVLGPVFKNIGDNTVLAGNANANVAYLIKGTLGQADFTPPGFPTSFTAVANGTTNNLSWTNPGDSDFVGTVIRYRTGTYPSSPTDGNPVCNRTASPGTLDSFDHTGVNPSDPYYYSAFAYDGEPNYSLAVLASTVASALPDWINETFDGRNDGNLGGQAGWMTPGVASAQVQAAYAKGGAGKSALMDTVPSGLSMANQISFSDKTSGYCYVRLDVAQDAVGTLGQLLGYVYIYGADSSTEITKLHIQKGRMFIEYGPGSLATVAPSVTNLGWYDVRIGLNVATRKMDVWLDGVKKVTNYSWKGTATNVSSVVISSNRNPNLNPQKAYVDNVRVQPTTGVVAVVRDDGAYTPSLSKLHFDFDAVAGILEYRYAIGTTPEGTNTKAWTSCGTTTDNTVTGLSLSENQIYYISAQCGTGSGVWGSSTISNGITVAPGIATIQEAKALADSSAAKALRGKLVSAAFPGYFYLQEPNSPSGIKVVSAASVLAGDQVDVAGSVGGSGSERLMDCTGNAVEKTSPGPGGPRAVVLANASVGGAALNEFTPGVVGGIGPNNIGLYICVCGRVTQRKTAIPDPYFYIDDGSGRADGTQTDGVDNVGVRMVADPAGYAENSYVVVTGISSCFNNSGLRPCILPVQIQTLLP